MRRSLLVAAAAATLTFGLASATSASADHPTTGGSRNDSCPARPRRNDVQVLALTADGSLVCFRENRPDRARTIGTVSGLSGDTSLIGIDHRPANGLLYGVGNAGGVYTIDPATAVATRVSTLNQPLQGTSFGVDFNPTVDRLRVVSDQGQNLRVNVDDGTTNVDAPLNIPGATPVNPALGVTAVAYTNNDADPATATTLFDLDTTNDNVNVQAPANAGSLSPTGRLGVDAAGDVGFDIYSELGYGTTVGNRALASFAAPGQPTTLYRVDLLTGRVAKVGWFAEPVVDLSIPLAQS